MLKKKTICQAALTVLTNANRPMSAEDILNAISQDALYHFKAKSPLNVLKSELRKHSVGISTPLQSRMQYFQILKDGTFWLKDKPVL